MHTADNDKLKQQKQIRRTAQGTLQRLYNAEPKTKAAIKHAYGYAVFSDLGVKILFGGTGNEKGVAVNNRTKHETFMKMMEVQAANYGAPGSQARRILRAGCLFRA